MITKKTAKNLSSGIHEAAAAKPGAFGKKMLEKMGWQEGEGLGVDGNGAKGSVRVVKKDDTKGLGIAREEAKNESAKGEWWNDAFKAAASAVPDRVSSRSRADSSSSSSSSSTSESFSSDDNGIDLSRLSEADRQLYLLCGKRRLGRRANMAQKGKWKREVEADKKLLSKLKSAKSEEQESKRPRVESK